MKRFFAVSMMLALVLTGAAAESSAWHLSILIGGSQAGGDAMGGLGARLTRDFGDHLEVGVTGYARSEIADDRTDDEGRTYHLESGYTALLIIPRVNIGKHVEITMPIETGTGLLQFRYAKPYQREMRWTEELLDSVTHSVFSIGIEPKISLGPDEQLSLGFGWQATGPIRTDLAESDELTGLWGRLVYTRSFNPHIIL